MTNKPASAPPEHEEKEEKVEVLGELVVDQRFEHRISHVCYL